MRYYFYHAPPATGQLTNPIDGTTFRLEKTKVALFGHKLLEDLALEQNFALRLGESLAQGWKLGRNADEKFKNNEGLEANDIIPNINQKGVDLRIGMDIGLLALRKFVDTIVVVTGDSDLIPAFKLVQHLF